MKAEQKGQIVSAFPLHIETHFNTMTVFPAMVIPIMKMRWVSYLYNGNSYIGKAVF